MRRLAGWRIAGTTTLRGVGGYQARKTPRKHADTDWRYNET